MTKQVFGLATAALVLALGAGAAAQTAPGRPGAGPGAGPGAVTLAAWSFSGAGGVAGLMSNQYVTAGATGSLVPATETAQPCGGSCMVRAGFLAEARATGVVPHPMLAAFSLYGSGVAGSVGVPGIGWGADVNTAGASVTFTVGGAAPTSPAVLFLSMNQGSSAIGGGVANLLVDFGTLIYPIMTAAQPYSMTSATGAASVAFPNLPMSGISGSGLFAQWLVLDGSSPAVDPSLGGFALTRGLRVQF